MRPLITNSIKISIPFSISNDAISIQHPTKEDIPELISLLRSEDLDLRKLVPVSKEHYPSMGKNWIKEEWDKALCEFHVQQAITIEVLKQLSKQAEGILKYNPIPLKGTDIKDPFNMGPVETVPIQILAQEQIENIIVAKNKNKIIGMGRLLEVEGNVEIVSLLTSREWRGKGIASIIIDELFERSSIRPVYSFQVPKLIPFYIRRYQKHGTVQIEPFTKLPQALQRDLFHMNIFWGPYTILSIR